MDATISPWMFWWFLHKSNELPTLSYTHTHTHQQHLSVLRAIWHFRELPALPEHGHLTDRFLRFSLRIYEVGEYLLTKALSALLHRSEKIEEKWEWTEKKKYSKKKRNHSPRWKGEEKGDCFCRLWLIYELQCLKWELGTGRSCASSHSTCFEQGFNFICKCLLSRQGVPAQMKAPQSVSSNSLGLITSLQSLRELEI